MTSDVVVLSRNGCNILSEGNIQYSGVVQKRPHISSPTARKIHPLQHRSVQRTLKRPAVKHRASSDNGKALSSTFCSLHDPFLPGRLLQRLCSTQPWNEVWHGGRMLLQITEGSWVKIPSSPSGSPRRKSQCSAGQQTMCLGW